MKTVLLTSIPSPYRVTVFDALNKLLGEDFVVFYTSRHHPAFNWKTEALNHVNHFINESDGTDFSKVKSVYKKLNLAKPDMVITCGFSPVMLKAMFYAFINNKRLAANTDAWELVEKSYSFLHILLRKVVYKRMSAFLPVSKKGASNFKRYHIPDSKIFISHYAIDNAYSSKFINSEKKFDLMFSGQFIDRKMPFFFCEVAELVKKKYNNIRLLLIGDGPLKDDVLNRLKNSDISFEYPGFIQKNELPAYYASARIFLFPTKVDSWGVVANDACAVGTPVITCENAGAAHDLIVNGYNGYVLPLDAKVWADHIELLLTDQSLYNRFSENCITQIRNYNPEEAAQGIINAIHTK